MEDALTHERYLLRTLMEHSLDLIYFKDEQSRFLRVNTAFARRINATPDDCIGKTDAEFNSSKEEVEHFNSDDVEVIDTKEPKHVPMERITAADGSSTYTVTRTGPAAVHAWAAKAPFCALRAAPKHRQCGTRYASISRQATKACG